MADEYGRMMSEMGTTFKVMMGGDKAGEGGH
jgi:hypothetical protein